MIDLQCACTCTLLDADTKVDKWLIFYFKGKKQKNTAQQNKTTYGCVVYWMWKREYQCDVRLKLKTKQKKKPMYGHLVCQRERKNISVM